MSIAPPFTLAVVGLAGLEPGLSCLHDLLSGIDPQAAITFLVAVPPAVDQDALNLVFESLKAQELQDQTQLQAGKIYMVAVGSILSLGKDGIATLEKNGDGPVDDIVLKAIAETFQGDAVGVLLSGRHGAGALGLRAIFETGGLTMMEPLTERKQQSLLHDVDHVLDHLEIAGELNIFAHRRAQRAEQVVDIQTELPKALPEICRLVHEVTGHDLRHYKKLTLLRRINRLIQVKHLDSAQEYVELLKTDDQSVRRLLDEVLIQVTSFFRDSEAFAYLAKEVIKPLLARKTRDQELRIWVPGCCTGEEVYSLAMLCCEALELDSRGHKVRLFGTDVSSRSLATARRGEYALGIERQVNPERLERFFDKQADRYVVKSHLREMCLFASQNLVGDPPFSDIDLISCRNLMIYLGNPLQKKLMSIFHYALKSNGYVFLGPSEHLAEPNNLFRTVHSKFRISQRRDVEARPWISFEPAQPGRKRSLDSVSQESFVSAKRLPIHILSQRILLEDFAPPYAVVTEDGGISYLFGETREFLNPSVDYGIEQMARAGLQRCLRETLAESRRTQSRAVGEGGTVETPEGHQSVRVIVQPLPSVEEEDNYMVVFEKLGQARNPSKSTSSDNDKLISQDKNARRLERELLETRSELDAALQAHRATHEELKSYNEELRSMNEELQSSNEELRLSQEETQAAVQISQTAKTDLENLLDSTEIATVFVDRTQRVQGFTPAAAEILNIIPSDIGRPFSHLTHTLEYMAPLPKVDSERSELALRGITGRSYLRRVLPYRQADGSVHGSVITFIDVSALREAQKELQASQQQSALKTRFHASLGHELRTPLAGLSGMLDMLLTTELNHVQKDFVQTIKDCSDSLRLLLDDLLDLARIEIHKLVLKPTSLGIEDFAQRVVKPFSHLSAKSGVEVRVELQDLPNFLVFDPLRLQQILNNLIGNSFKFTSQGSITLAISCLKRKGDLATVKFCVSDTGTGISEQHKQSIFMPFVQGEDSRLIEPNGIGLGLSISRQLINLMGGSINFASEVDQGSSFWFELELPMAESLESAEFPSSKPRISPNRKGRILVAEDNAINQRVITMQLQNMGHSVVVVGNGLLALECLEQEHIPFDLVILDCQMPLLDGYETSRRIRASQSPYSTLPILALTARALEDDETVCSEAGMDAYLSKPASISVLAEIIQTLLQANKGKPIPLRNPKSP